MPTKQIHSTSLGIFFLSLLDQKYIDGSFEMKTLYRLFEFKLLKRLAVYYIFIVENFFEFQKRVFLGHQKGFI